MSSVLADLPHAASALNIVHRQLGRSDLGTESACLQGIDPIEIINGARSRRPPTISANAGLVP